MEIQDSNSPLQVDAVITWPGGPIKVVATDFERDPAFPDAVALVVAADDRVLRAGDHLQTPWGMVRVAASPKRSAQQLQLPRSNPVP